MENGNREREVEKENVRACWTLIKNCMYMEHLNPEERQELERARKKTLVFLKELLLTNLNILEKLGVSISEDIKDQIGKIEFGTINNEDFKIIENSLLSQLNRRENE